MNPERRWNSDSASLIRATYVSFRWSKPLSTGLLMIHKLKKPQAWFTLTTDGFVSQGKGHQSDGEYLSDSAHLTTNKHAACWPVDIAPAIQVLLKT